VGFKGHEDRRRGPDNHHVFHVSVCSGVPGHVISCVRRRRRKLQLFNSTSSPLSGAADGSSVPACDAVMFQEQFLLFERTPVPSSSEPSRTAVIIRDVRKHSPKDTASHARRIALPAAPL
jgi:hypothetical protein